MAPCPAPAEPPPPLKVPLTTLTLNKHCSNTLHHTACCTSLQCMEIYRLQMTEKNLLTVIFFLHLGHNICQICH